MRSVTDDLRTDADLVSLLAQGDVAVLGVLFDRHQRYALGLAHRVLNDRVLAEEVVQDAFVALLERAATFDPTRGSFRAWLLSFVHHKAVDVVRREEALRRRALAAQGLESRREEPDPADEAWQIVQIEHVRAALVTLTDDERRAIETAYFGGLTYRQTAELMDVPEGTIKTRMRSGLRKLRHALETRGAHVG